MQIAVGVESRVERFVTALILTVACGASPAAAQLPADTVPPRQHPTSTASTFDWTTLPELAGSTEDRIRRESLTGGRRLQLFRSASGLAVRAQRDTSRFPTPLAIDLIRPSAAYYWNSDLPFTFNDGPVWAGRGGSFQLMTGIRARFGPATLTIAPQLFRQRNAEFQVIPFQSEQNPARHRLSNPFHGEVGSIDMPLRMGRRARGELTPGQSSFVVEFGPAALGAATENLWWGPAIRNPLILSNTAPGFPHLFLRTAEPFRTRFLDVEAQWIAGRLRESFVFDSIGANNFRSMGGLAFAFRPAFDRDLAVGFTRVVYGVQRERGFPLGAFFDVFADVGQPNSRPDSLREPTADQLFSLFAHWAFPAAGFEVYGEWGRYEQPTSLRDFLTAPHHSQGYTLGLQWVSAPVAERGVRFQTEASFMEPSASYRDRPQISWYTSRPVPHGWTHQGQPLGAGIGPGASAQWVALDYFHDDRATVGLFANRIRWDNAAFYESGRTMVSHDVSMLVGARAGVSLRGYDVAAELYTGRRMNYLFQNEDFGFNDDKHVDIRNHSLRLTISPRPDR